MLVWKAYYSDGTFLDQYGVNGKSGYENIDRTKLFMFAIIDKTVVTDESFAVAVFDGKNYDTRRMVNKQERIVFRLHFEEGQRLIYRIIGIKKLNVRTLEERDNHLIMVGWQQNINGKNIQSLNYINEDGSIEQTGKFVNPPALKEYELG